MGSEAPDTSGRWWASSRHGGVRQYGYSRLGSSEVAFALYFERVTSRDVPSEGAVGCAPVADVEVRT